MKPFYAWLGLWGLVLCACTARTSASLGTPDKPAQVADSTGSGRAAQVPMPLRIIVVFKDPVAYSSAGTLQMLQQQTQTRQVTYVSALYGNSHIYLFAPAQGQTEADVLRLLQSMPNIRAAEIDRIARAS